MLLRARVRERQNAFVAGARAARDGAARAEPAAAADGRCRCAEFAAELISLPSGLLAMVCAAIVKLKVLLGHAGVREAAGGPTRSRGAPRLSEYWGQRSPLAVISGNPGVL